MEKWKYCLETNQYLVSNTGKVKHSRHTKRQADVGKEIKLTKNGTTAQLVINGKLVSRSINRLVYEAFNGEVPEDCCVSVKMDYSLDDTLLDRLYLRKEIKNVKRKPVTALICGKLFRYESREELMDDLNTSRGYVQRRLNGKEGNDSIQIKDGVYYDIDSFLLAKK